MKQGIVGIKPEIKKVDLDKSKLTVWLVDGRVIITPKKLFSFLRKPCGKAYISDGDTIIFDKADEVIHIEEVLGRYEDYRYKG